MKDKIAVCKYCKKEFIVTGIAQEKALERGGTVRRTFCNECLKRWRKGEIHLPNAERSYA